MSTPSKYNRQNSLKISSQELDKVLELVEGTFEKEWLEMKEEHPLRELWDRRDALATNELFSLGTCIERLNFIDTEWVKKQIHIIKTGPANNRIGAFFEILGLGFLAAERKDFACKGKSTRL